MDTHTNSSTMTLKEWIELYYPTTAIDVCVDAVVQVKEGKDPMLSLIGHSLRKWKGIKIIQEGRVTGVSLSPRNNFVFDETSHSVQTVKYFQRPSTDNISCSLCQYYYNPSDDYVGVDSSCTSCPLAIVGNECNADGSSYETFSYYGDVQGMIDALQDLYNLVSFAQSLGKTLTRSN